MINFKELENKLDDSLNKETKESLTNWLTKKRKNMAFETLTEEEVETVLTGMTLLSEDLKNPFSLEMVDDKTQEIKGYLIMATRISDKKIVGIANETIGKPFYFKEEKDCKKALKEMRKVLKFKK